MRFKDSFHPYAGVTIFFWSLTYVLTRLVMQNFSAFTLGFLRYAAASVALMLIVPAARIKMPKMTDFKWFLASGFFGFFLYMIAFNSGCKTVTAATSSVILATVPVITALLARLVYREQISGMQWAATAVEFSGVLALTLMDNAFSLNCGIFWLFLAAISLSVYNLLQRKLTKIYSGLQASAYSIFAGTAMLSVFLPDSVRAAQAAPRVQLLYIAFLGVFASAVAYATWAAAIKKAKHTSSVSNYMFITPFLTTLFSFALAGETPDRPTVIGGTIIMAGMVLFNWGGKLREQISHVKSNRSR